MGIPTHYALGTHFSTPTYVPAQTLSDTTRYLCCAPYVDSAFANQVIEEVLEDEQRAVPPSYGFDLDPVVRHCLRARRLLIARHAVVTLLLVVGLWANPFFTLAWLGFGGALLVFRRRRQMSFDIWIRVMLGFAGAAVVLCCLGGVLAAFLSGGGMDALGGGSEYDLDYGLDGAVATGGDGSFQTLVGLYLYLPPILGLSCLAALFLFRRHAYTVLTDELRPGAPASRPAARSARVERRLATAAAAQRGNITVQERDPFLGSGRVHHGWSFAIPLRPAGKTPAHAAATLDGPGNGRRTQAGSDRIELDGAELNQRVRDAVLRLRDPNLPDAARVPGVFLTPHVVADGVRGLGDPLLNPHTRTPHTLASDAALEAIMKCPQGGLRYYERAVVPAAGKPITAADGSPVLPGQDLGIDIAAHMHFAVEGGMLYAEFMGTVLPPVRDAYTLVDALREERVTGRAALDTVRAFPTDVLCSPWWLVRTAWRSLTMRRRMDRAREASQEYLAYDYGARMSVRDLAAQPDVAKFLQALDGWKYIKLLDRTVADAVVDFLTEKGVDTSEFRAAVTHVRNEYGNVFNISGGQQNIGGTNVTMTQNSGGGGANG